MQDANLFKIYCILLLSELSQNEEWLYLSLKPSAVDISFLYQACDMVLKSLKSTVRNELFFTMCSKLSTLIFCLARRFTETFEIACFVQSLCITDDIYNFQWQRGIIVKRHTPPCFVFEGWSALTKF